MARMNVPLIGFTAGEISVEALTRVDLERVRFGGEFMENFLPKAIGPMVLRPGFGHLDQTRENLRTKLLPFVKSAADKAIIELTNLRARFLVDDFFIIRDSVSTTIQNGDFSGLAGWNDADDAGASSTLMGGSLALVGTGDNYARRQQLVSVAGVDIGRTHAIRVTVSRGPILFRVGSTTSNDNYISETLLRTGTHSLAFVPSGDFHVTVYSNTPVRRLVANIEIEPGGVLELPTPWGTNLLDNVRHDQSGDVLFIACPGERQRRIERRGDESWSVCEYAPDDGPFRNPNLARLTLTPSDTTGNITLTASQRLFNEKHVGALFKMTHTGQTASATLAADDTATGTIRVIGSEDDFRRFTVKISKTFNATITLQRAFGEPTGWIDVETFTAPINTIRDDEYPNEIVYYRLAIKAGDYTSGAADCELIYSASAQTGIVRVTGYNSTTSVDAEVLKELGKAAATADWREGSWSDYRGYPASVAFHDGRLFWGAADTVYGSVSDAYESFDQELEGDAGPIIRSVSTGPADGLYWLKSVIRLLTGGPSQEVSIRSSSFDEPLTPTQFTARVCSSRGSANLDTVKVDTSVIFAQRDRRRIFELFFEGGIQDYTSGDLTRLNPGICQPRVKAMAVQRQPETRIWAVLENGEVRVLNYERGDQVVAWSRVVTDGGVEDVCVLPGVDEDEVYFVVRRDVQGVRRFVEKLAKSGQRRLADCYVFIANGVPTTTVAGLTNLAGRQVVVWADGQAIADQSNMLTVSGAGLLILPVAATNIMVGLPYTGRYKSMKLAFAAEIGTALTQRKRIDHLGIILHDTAWAGIRIGRDLGDLATMRNLPQTFRGETVPANKIFDYYDTDAAAFAGAFDTDSRIAIVALSPYPATVVGFIPHMVTNERGHPNT